MKRWCEMSNSLQNKSVMQIYVKHVYQKLNMNILSLSIQHLNENIHSNNFSKQFLIYLNLIVKKRLKQKHYGQMMSNVLEFTFLLIGVHHVVLLHQNQQKYMKKHKQVFLLFVWFLYHAIEMKNRLMNIVLKCHGLLFHWTQVLFSSNTFNFLVSISSIY